ncbi:MAG: hypothetical protein IJY28_01380 [Clostridia bacterium]|nr:hypothetical protein [Clostridia bacterium]
MNPKNDPVQSVARQLGLSQAELNGALNSGNPAAILRKLPPEDARKLQQVLSDKNAAARVLASPEAKALMQQLFGGK